MKNNISYYSHDVGSHNHRKFKKLVGRYGLEGEAMFWRLNNLIGDSDGCLLDLTDDITHTDVADVLKLNFKKLEEFVAYLVECKLIYYVDQKITTDRCQETLQKLSRDRIAARNRKNGVSQNSLEVRPNSNRSSPKPLQSLAEKEASSRRKETKESKVKKVKEMGDQKSPEEKADLSKNQDWLNLEKSMGVKR